MTDGRPPLPSAIAPRAVLDMGDGMRWTAIDTPEAAHLANCLVCVPVSAYCMSDFAHPERGEIAYYALVEGLPEPTSMHVVMRVCFEEDDGGTMVVGHRNTDPYPRHGRAIAALGQHIGVDLGPSNYPYGRKGPVDDGRDLVDDEPGDEAEPPQP